MKYNNHQSKNVIEGDVSVAEFKMELNAKAFSVLTDGIYSNKIKAIIRELSTNAWDSHIEVGKDIPFEVHLPIYNEEYFYIRDYGTGMSEEKILDVYTTFFCSTKDQSNDFCGLIGIGSKSPMAYNTKTFHIESFYNGKCYTYCFFINDEGIPSYTKLDEQDTEEPNGLKVQFTVAESDRYYFEREANNVYKFFKVKPKCNKKLDAENPPRKYENNGVYSSDEDFSVVMGNIQYPIVINHDYLKDFDGYNNSSVIIEAKIGEVDFSASRESLAYTQKTLRFLKNKLEEYNEHLKTTLSKEIDSCENMFEAAIRYEELSHELLFHSNIKIPPISREYRGEEIPKEIDFECIIYESGRYGKKFCVADKIKLSSKVVYILEKPKTRTKIRSFVSELGKNAYILTEEQVNGLGIQKLVKDSSTFKIERTYNRVTSECYAIYRYALKPTTWTDEYIVEKKHNNLIIHGETYGTSQVDDILSFYKIKAVGVPSGKFKKHKGERLENFLAEKKKNILDFISSNEEKVNGLLLKRSGRIEEYVNGTSVSFSSIIDEADHPVLNKYKNLYEDIKFLEKTTLENEARILRISITTDSFVNFCKEYREILDGFRFSVRDAIVQQMKECYV